jgi:hypothetical protein
MEGRCQELVDGRGRVRDRAAHVGRVEGRRGKESKTSTWVCRRVPLLEFRHKQTTKEQQMIDSKIDQLQKPKSTIKRGSERQLRRRMKELQRR